MQIGTPSDVLAYKLRRTRFVIPTVTFCATAELWDITSGSGLQIPIRTRTPTVKKWHIGHCFDGQQKTLPKRWNTPVASYRVE